MMRMYWFWMSCSFLILTDLLSLSFDQYTTNPLRALRHFPSNQQNVPNLHQDQTLIPTPYHPPLMAMIHPPCYSPCGIEENDRLDWDWVIVRLPNCDTRDCIRWLTWRRISSSRIPMIWREACRRTFWVWRAVRSRLRHLRICMVSLDISPYLQWRHVQLIFLQFTPIVSVEFLLDPGTWGMHPLYYKLPLGIACYSWSIYTTKTSWLRTIAELNAACSS